jgi:hypothetical protein
MRSRTPQSQTPTRGKILESSTTDFAKLEIEQRLELARLYQTCSIASAPLTNYERMASLAKYELAFPPPATAWSMGISIQVFVFLQEKTAAAGVKL